jgi:hypothetical protein
MKILMRVLVGSSLVFYKDVNSFLNKTPRLDEEISNLTKAWWSNCKLGSIFEIHNNCYLVCVDKNAHSKVETKVVQTIVVVDGNEVVVV